ncbi:MULTISPECIES: hypothetical protein [Acetivibrio]|jgi:hypothetical protein|uniref:Uncharacterized protein n=1 Tax=Acetivibrio thermocellus AD2 TaxID=1138384 RepID=A0AB36TJD5_ACETH|nr:MULTISPECIES: hypothetical protein [Acetivibrio]ADU75672.1 hypothetical protein Clo1313_2682 [Acetivibrio thermocellus DSM 1313]ALX09691.1 hypothetical protein AD2_02711 [Acetivibrio thermocellus AD2]ANV77464.1 hypothetical protein LQRI_2723 [Acetivibrio thermocellus DSM 2360]EIC03579.1 hypothetical protein YSBL_2750 [Acetivibrio thermocellus YS]PFH03974.1 hypothetical protein M972_112793 [Acetivibrio thermocellus AD2]
MPRGVASVFSTLQNIDMFKQIEVLFNTKGIRLELPNTNKVQVWTTEGEMLNIEKKELLQNTSDISDYLIQFWWPQMDDVAIKLTCQGYLCVCDIYLDGLDESQTKVILDLLIIMTLQRFEIVGFVIDREELVSEFEWNKFFSNKEYLDSHYLELCGLKIFKKYELKEYKTEQLIDFKRDCVYVAIPNRERSTITLYLLC